MKVVDNQIPLPAIPAQFERVTKYTSLIDMNLSMTAANFLLKSIMKIDDKNDSVSVSLLC